MSAAPDVGKLLDRIESAILYTEALLTPGQMGARDGDWISVDAARANSSYGQLRESLTDLAQIRSEHALQGLDRVQTVIMYTEATVAPGNLIACRGGEVKVHAGRAGSSYRQLRLALKDLADVRVRLGVEAGASRPHPKP